MKKQSIKIKRFLSFILYMYWSTYSFAQIVEGGGDHSLFLCTDSVVHACGFNGWGQLGDNTSINKNIPVQIYGLTSINNIAGGYQHSLALKNNGTLWSWGYNIRGQLGDSTQTDRFFPTKVHGLTGIIAMSGGWYHSLAVKNDGTVWAWGYNTQGQLGDGTQTLRTTPVQVTGLTGIVAVAAGEAHSIALKNDGTVWAWGWNSYGQLGNGTNLSSYTPIQVIGLTGIVNIAGKGDHTIALKNDSTVWVWGYNIVGQLGNGTQTNSSIPFQVTGLNNIIAVAGGHGHSLALKNDGTVWGWGWNQRGQLGDGSIGISPCYCTKTPVQITNLSGIKYISAGGAHTVAMKNDGTTWAFGLNNNGEIGNGIFTLTGCQCEPTPVQLTMFCLTTSAENEIQNKSLISISPNPFSRLTTLQIDQVYKNSSLTLYNSFGQIVKQIDNLTEQKIVFHRDNIPSGLYFIRLTKENKVFAISKLVIVD